MASVTGNPWVAFAGLLKPGAKSMATVAEVYADGTVLVTLRSGAQLRVRGDGAVADRVVIQGGAVVGPAPNLPEQSVEV